MNKKVLLGIIGVVLIGGIVLYILNPNNIFKRTKEEEPEVIVVDDETNDFNAALIKRANVSENYLISPYSIEVALNMLKDGANGETKEEIEKVIGTREIKNLEVKDKLGIANAAFIKNSYKDIVKDSYYNKLKNKYNADILYDEFTTPQVINNWVKEKTNGMIEKILESMDPEFAMGLSNAVALDVKWLSSFDCESTSKKAFTKNDGSKIQVEMMSKTFKQSYYKYFENDEVEGVVLPYEKINDSDVELEFVGILPKKTANDFIANIKTEKLQKIDENARTAGMDFNISVSLPRFSYEYSIEDFIDVLKDLGIKKAFNSIDADFSNIFDMSKTDNNFYVNKAIHKAIIELNEKGTKAAAVTSFALAGNAMVQEPPEIKEITFDKPFVYMIRDSKSKEIVFFGSVYEPNIWEKTTCDNEM